MFQGFFFLPHHKSKNTFATRVIPVQYFVSPPPPPPFCRWPMTFSWCCFCRGRRRRRKKKEGGVGGGGDRRMEGWRDGGVMVLPSNFFTASSCVSYQRSLTEIWSGFLRSIITINNSNCTHAHCAFLKWIKWFSFTFLRWFNWTINPKRCQNSAAAFPALPPSVATVPPGEELDSRQRGAAELLLQQPHQVHQKNTKSINQ